VPGRTENLIEREKFLTLYGQFHYLLTLNEALLQHFLLIFVTKETDSVQKKSKIIGKTLFLFVKVGCRDLSPEYDNDRHKRFKV